MGHLATRPHGSKRGVLALLAVLAAVALPACSGPEDDETIEDTAAVGQALCRSVQLDSTPPGPLSSNSSVLLTATGVTCNPGQTPQYRFLYRRVGAGGQFTELRAWGASHTATFSNVGLPAGEYQLQVRVRFAGSSLPYESLSTIVLSSGNVCPSVTLAASPPSPQLPGTTLTFRASAICTEGGAEYRFFTRLPGEQTLQLVRGWGGPTVSGNTAGFPVGEYEAVVEARGAGNASPESTASLIYTLSDRCTGGTIAAAPPPPLLVGSSATLSATPSCAGGGVPQLRYVVRSAGATAWTEIQPWGAATSAVWNTAGLAAGAYELGVEVRAPGLTGDAQERQTLPYALAIANRPPAITSDGGGSTAAISTYENMPPTVTTVVATDPDPGDTVTYTISGGSDAASFHIDNLGDLSFQGGPPDHETPRDQNADNVYEVEVQASDGTLVDSQLLLITVTDVPDDPIPLSVLEGLTFVVNVVRIHPGMPLPVTSYQIAGGADAAHFTVDATTGRLSFVAPQDHETPADADLDNVYEVAVWLLDGFFLEEQRFRVAVTDFPEGPIALSVPENTTAVTTLAPRHPALQLPVTFSITGGADAQLFVVDATTGQLWFAQPPDHELPGDAAAPFNVYEVEVGVTDGSFAETQRLQVTVTDVFEPITYAKPENSTFAGRLVGRGPFPTGQIFYHTILGGADGQHFQAALGDALHFVTAPDHEAPTDANQDNVYEVVVELVGLVSRETQVINVTVTDVEDGPALVSVPENSTAVATVDTTGLVPPVTFEIVGGADNARFAVDANGALAFVAAPDFEQPSDTDQDNAYLVAIAVTDSQTLVYRSFVVTVTNANDPPLAGWDERASVPENSTAVLTLTAVDPDPGTTLTYALVGGDDGSQFTVDAATGALSFRAAPDFEAPTDVDGDNLYLVVAQVSDGLATTSLGIGIRVTDVVEGGDTTASPPILLPVGSTVRDGNENADIPLQVHAELTDTDGSESLTVTFTAQFGEALPGAVITDGAHAHTFTTDPLEAVDVSTWNVDAIVARQAPNVDADLIFRITARSTESNGGATAEVSTHVTARFYTAGAGVNVAPPLDLICLTAPGLCLDGPIGDVDSDGLIDPTEFGRVIRGGGDLNGDGFADFVVGASSASPGGLARQHAGAAYVVFGGANGLSGALNAAALNGPNGFRFDGIAATHNLGRSVDLSGDLDGDGFDELIVSGDGRLHVLYGHAAPYAGSVSATDGVELYQGLAVFGLPVATADVNGDGLADLIAGWIDPSSGFSAPGAHVIYGSTTRLSGPIDWTAIDGTTQSVLLGSSTALGIPSAVASAGDVNGDGYDDLLIGIAPQLEYGPGIVHVVFGRAAGFGGTFELDAVLDGTTGFSISSTNPLDIVGLGTTVGSAGDVNGDGYDDIIVGAPNAIAQDDPRAGVSYVIFGHAGSFPADLDLRQLGTAGVRIEGAEAYDEAGYAVSGAGDMNGDGLDDMAVGALYAAPFGYRPGPAGDTYVLFGKETGLGPVIDVASLPADVGARLEGGFSIWSLGPAGDSDGDGLDELLIGAPNIGVSGGSGVNGLAYRVHGALFSVVGPRGLLAGTNGDDTLTSGTTLGELIQALGGDDVLDGGGGDDLLLAGPGDDVIVYHPGARRISGGPGFDSLEVPGDLDLTDPAVTRRRHLVDRIEQIDLRDGDVSTLSLDLVGLTRLSGDRAGPIAQGNALIVRGEAGDTVRPGPGWAQTGTAQHDGTTFDVFRSSPGNAVLWVEQPVDADL